MELPSAEIRVVQYLSASLEGWISEEDIIRATNLAPFVVQLTCYGINEGLVTVFKYPSGTTQILKKDGATDYFKSVMLNEQPLSSCFKDNYVFRELLKKEDKDFNLTLPNTKPVTIQPNKTQNSFRPIASKIFNWIWVHIIQVIIGLIVAYFAYKFGLN